MGDLIAFQEYENARLVFASFIPLNVRRSTLTMKRRSAPFTWDEYNYMWKGDRRYWDFSPDDTQNSSCQYPRFWDDTGFPEPSNFSENYVGCRASEFDLVWISTLFLFASLKTC